MIFEIILVILLAIMSIELGIIERKIRTQSIPTVLRNEYDDRFAEIDIKLDELNWKLDELLDEKNKQYSSPFGKDVAGDHDY